MPDLLLYVKASVISAGASAIIALAFGIWSRRKQPPIGEHQDDRLTKIGVIVSLMIGVFVGYGVQQFRWKWPPANAMERFLEIVLPAVVAIELLSVCFGNSKVMVILRTVVAVTCGRILLHDSVYLKSASVDDHSSSWLTTLLPTTVLLTFVWWAMLRMSQRRAALSAVTTIVLCLQAGGIAIMLAGYLKGGAAAIPLVSSLLAIVLISALILRANISGALTSVAVVSLFGLLFIGRYFGALSSTNAVVILLSPLLCWLTEFSRTKHWSATRVGLIRLGIVSTVLLVVLFVARQEFNRRMKPLLSATFSSEEEKGRVQCC